MFFPIVLQDTSGGGTLGSQLLPLDKPVHFEIDVDGATPVSEAAKPVYKPGATRYSAKVLRIAGRLFWCPRVSLWLLVTSLMHQKLQAQHSISLTEAQPRTPNSYSKNRETCRYGAMSTI